MPISLLYVVEFACSFVWRCRIRWTDW